MMNLPLNITQNYKNATPNLVAQNLSLLDKLLEDEKYVAIQFLFNQKAVWKVDLSIGNPSKPLSKIGNIYIDALNSTHDVIVYFPDTGYEVRVAAGTVFFPPSLVSRGSYVFYVSLVGQVTDATDTVNIFALNVVVPFFDSLWQYPQGLSTSSPTPTGTNISTWFFVGTNISYDNFFSNQYELTNNFGIPIIRNIPQSKYLLKFINYTINLVGQGLDWPFFPAPDGLLKIQIDLVDSIDGIINSQIFINNDSHPVINSDFFEYQWQPNYRSSLGSELNFQTTVLQGAYASPTEQPQNFIAFNCIFDYIT